VADLFKDIIPSILQTKKPCLDNEKDYVPFVVNKSISFHYDCILYANQMNMYPNLDPSLQYHFYLNSIRPHKRPFQKWHKRQTLEDLELVKEYHKYSNEKAKEALLVLSEDDIMEIKRLLDKGGMNNDKSRRSNMGDSS
jgi:hypothetical protein